MSQRFVRCAHCGLPHGIEESVCPITNRPIETRKSRAPESRRADPPSSRVPAAHAPRETPSPFEAVQTQPPPLTGQVLGGKYRALRILGEGGMGAVYEAEHIALHRKVAVKVLHPAQARKKASVQRFQNEAHVAGQIGHPNICEIYDMGELEDGSPFLVMELLTGETLADRIASEGALPFDDIVDVMTQVLSGLVAAHDKGIIHRDIKPENVFLTRRVGLPAMVKLLDFGISKMAGAEELHLTRTGMVMGTPFYMSPEQARGDRNLDRRVDIYAAGVVMYECLTGRRPFHAANYNALLMQILTAEPRKPSDVRPAVPEAFEVVVAKAMQRDRDKRYQNALDMQRDIMALRDPGAIRRIPSVPPEPVPLVTPRRKADDAPASSKAQPPPSPKPSYRPQPVEMPAVSINLEGRDLLDSGLLRGASSPPPPDPVESDSGSLEIPIVAEEPVTAPKPLYRPDPLLVAAQRASQPPPPPPSAPAQMRPPSMPPPRPSTPPPSMPRSSPLSSPRPPSATPPRPPAPPSARPAAPPAQPSQRRPPPAAAAPSARAPQPPQPEPARGEASRPQKRAAPIPAIPPRTEVQAPPQGKRRAERLPTPTALDLSDAPWADDQDADPTEIGSIFGIPRSSSDTPIDADSTERIPPERLARFQRSLPRVAHEVHDVLGGDPRAEPVETSDEDEAPTTLFDRRAVKAKAQGRLTTGRNQALRSTTERAPAPTPSRGRPPSVAPIPQAPLPRVREPKDR